MRPPSESPKTRMNRKLETTGAATVWDHSFRTRSTSREVSATKPRWRSARAVSTRSRLGGARTADEVADDRSRRERDRERAGLAQALGEHVAGEVADVEGVLALLRLLARRWRRRRSRRLGGRRRGGLGLGLGLGLRRLGFRLRAAERLREVLGER